MDGVLFLDHQCALPDPCGSDAYMLSWRTRGGSAAGVAAFLGARRCGPLWKCKKHSDARCGRLPCLKDRHVERHWEFKWHHHFSPGDVWLVYGACTGLRRRSVGFLKLTV